MYNTQNGAAHPLLWQITRAACFTIVVREFVIFLKNMNFCEKLRLLATFTRFRDGWKIPLRFVLSLPVHFRAIFALGQFFYSKSNAWSNKKCVFPDKYTYFWNHDAFLDFLLQESVTNMWQSDAVPQVSGRPSLTCATASLCHRLMTYLANLCHNTPPLHVRAYSDAPCACAFNACLATNPSPRAGIVIFN